MNTKLPSNQSQFCLPNVSSLESSEQAFIDAFFRSAQILHQYLEQIKSAVQLTQGFTEQPFNLAILELFSKMCNHYYSYILLEIHHQDRTGSNFLIEQLLEAAITLTYLIEEADNSFFLGYVTDSLTQANHLLVEVKAALNESPNYSDLLLLKAKLENFVSTHQEYASQVASPVAQLKESRAVITSQRAQKLGFSFIINPARSIALQVASASWLDLQLNHSPLSLDDIELRNSINFVQLRDASHLCLHATRAFLDEIENHHLNMTHLDSQQRLNMLYEWFHNAHRAYQQYSLTKTAKSPQQSRNS